METKKWKDIKTKGKSADRVARIDREVKTELIAIELKELREMAGKTQQEVADIAAMTQSELSRFEKREDHMVSTLRRYVRALGGEVEVVAVVGDRRLVLRGV